MTSTVEGARAIPGQCRRMSFFGTSRWVVLLLALVFAFSTLLHVTGGDHGAFAEDRGHELVAASQGDDAACHPDASGHLNDGSCTIGVSCALCVPVAVMAAPMQALVQRIRPVSPTTSLDNGLALQFRPPKLSVRA